MSDDRQDNRQDGRPDDRFESDWLALRAPADHAARSSRLEAVLIDALRSRPTPWRIIDLGAGAGSNPRHLAPRLPGPQRWTLIDHDAGLLERAAVGLEDLRHPDGHALRFEYSVAALEPLAGAVSDAVLDECDLLTASALIDLVSADWLDSLADRARASGSAVLVTLSVDGDWRFIPRADRARGPAGDGSGPDETLDDRMRALYRAHQARDKGLGRALGGEAPGRLADALRRRGFRVELEASPWRLVASEQLPLAHALLAGWRDALIAQAPDERRAIDAWIDDRDRALRRGDLGVEVGHVDLLALP